MCFLFVKFKYRMIGYSTKQMLGTWFVFMA